MYFQLIIKQFKIVGSIFQILYGILPGCMQKLRSINMSSKNFERQHGFYFGVSSRVMLYTPPGMLGGSLGETNLTFLGDMPNGCAKHSPLLPAHRVYQHKSWPKSSVKARSNKFAQIN